MRTSREETARNREKILVTAGKLFRERGIKGVSVAEIMAAAGLTHGGFYRHFPSKEVLAAEALACVAKKTEAQWQEVRYRAEEDTLAALIDRYLTPQHRDSAATGCIYAALGCETGRSEDHALHQLFAKGLEGLLVILSQANSSSSTTEQRRMAIGHLSSLTGALILSRATRGTPLSDDFLSETRQWLEELVPSTLNNN